MCAEQNCNTDFWVLYRSSYSHWQMTYQDLLPSQISHEVGDDGFRVFVVHCQYHRSWNNNNKSFVTVRGITDRQRCNIMHCSGNHILWLVKQHLVIDVIVRRLINDHPTKTALWQSLLKWKQHYNNIIFQQYNNYVMSSLLLFCIQTHNNLHSPLMARV